LSFIKAEFFSKKKGSVYITLGCFMGNQHLIFLLELLLSRRSLPRRRLSASSQAGVLSGGILTIGRPLVSLRFLFLLPLIATAGNPPDPAIDHKSQITENKKYFFMEGQ